jgi:hypothetical protein
VWIGDTGGKSGLSGGPAFEDLTARARIRQAALAQFAEQGFERATRASFGHSVSNRPDRYPRRVNTSGDPLPVACQQPIGGHAYRRVRQNKLRQHEKSCADQDGIALRDHTEFKRSPWVLPEMPPEQWTAVHDSFHHNSNLASSPPLRDDSPMDYEGPGELCPHGCTVLAYASVQTIGAWSDLDHPDATGSTDVMPMLNPPRSSSTWSGRYG